MNILRRKKITIPSKLLKLTFFQISWEFFPQIETLCGAFFHKTEPFMGNVFHGLLDASTLSTFKKLFLGESTFTFHLFTDYKDQNQEPSIARGA